MNSNFTEADGKLFRRYEKAMLEQLTCRINEESMAILSESSLTEHEKYLKLYRHARNSNEIVADCFDGWSRSRMSMFRAYLLQHDLIPQEMWDQLSEPARGSLERMMDL
jgi:hypothetical protein